MIRRGLKKVFGNGILLSAACRHLDRSIAVLGYHDLCEEREFSSWMRVKVDEFEKQLVELKKYCVFIEPDDLFAGKNVLKGRLNLLVTFDDGFFNNFRLALPILKKHNMPGLFFVSTWHVQSGEPFWFEEIVAAIQTSGLSSLDLMEFGVGKYTFRLGDDCARWDDIERLLRDIKGLGGSEDSNSKRIVDFVVEKLGGNAAFSTNGHRPLNSYEIYEMHRTGICFFGSHSHKHEILTNLENEAVERNLVESKRILEEIVGKPITHLSYPNGDVDDRVKNIAKATGFKFAYGIKPGLIDNDACDAMDIPRILVGGYDSVEDIFFRLLTQMGRKRLGLGHKNRRSCI